MQFNRVKINSIIKNQLPEFVEQEFPLVSEFLSAYYRSLESQGAPYDLIQNIDSYIKVDNLSNLNDTNNIIITNTNLKPLQKAFPIDKLIKTIK